jgi:hypothetical protein
MTAALPDGPAEDTPTEPEAPNTQATADPEPSPNSEAARYRVERNEARAERDSLTERLTSYQRRECEAAVADLLDQPGDLWDIGQADLTAFYKEDGELDEAELRAAAGALCEMRPKLAKPRGPRHQSFGQFTPPPPRPGVGWSQVING